MCVGMYVCAHLRVCELSGTFAQEAQAGDR